MNSEIEEQNEFFKALDKGIDDMENNHLIPHEEAMKIIYKRISTLKKSKLCEAQNIVDN